ncbi:cilia- and flagella-associated protein 91-like isoform X2 [Ischnura elegans]|nr:cilia- and flagella-associated protein 91-like isoform X2 [Ischnura elegans]XP_046401004.1 cilia- and flagella-associated protein 91-like isoform X2 [Ischnura elegans]
MFSDSSKYPPACIKVKSLDRVPPCVDRSWKCVEEKSRVRAVDVTGSHRHLFYCRPNVTSLTAVAVQDDSGEGKECETTSEVNLDETDAGAPRSRTFGIQTDYRESETQTIPYSPDVVLASHAEDTPVVLTLKNLKWGEGLPPGLHEIENIEWEINHRELKAFLLDPNNFPESKRPAILEYIHREEWLHREKEIQGIHDLRMGLAEKKMHKRGEYLSDRLQEVIARRYKKKLEENRKKIMKIRENHQRELRKLITKRKGISTKYKRPDPITEQADYSSELYGPLMRHGVDPRRRHEVPLNLRSKFLHDYRGLRILEQATDLMKTPEVFPVKEKPVHDRLCDRSSRWSTEQLQLLRKYFEGLKSEFDVHEERPLPKRLIPLPKPSPRPITPDLEGVPESEEKLYQAAVFMQKIIRGRAIQMLMFKGKEKSQDLIEELQTTQSVIKKEEIKVKEERIRTLLGYQNELEEKRNEEAYENMLSMLVGDTVGSMLDFLAKELVRLKDERCIHALLLLAQRERNRREAEEAGRRQVEERRRREHDEFFKQVVKVHQETVDIYLEDIVLNAMEWVATAESRSYIKELAKNIDQKTKDMEDRKNIWECKELVTELVYDYVIPEGYKEMVDQEREKEQREYLKTIQDEVYKTLSDPERKDLQPPEEEGEDASENVQTIKACTIKEEMEVLIKAMNERLFKLIEVPEGDETFPESVTADREENDGEEEGEELGDGVIENDEEESAQEVSDSKTGDVPGENLETRLEGSEDGDKTPDEKGLEVEPDSVKESTVEESVVEEPVVDEPVVDEPIVEEPVVEEPVVEEPTVEEEAHTNATLDQDITLQSESMEDATLETIMNSMEDELQTPDVEIGKEEGVAEKQHTEEGQRSSKIVSACSIKEDIEVIIQTIDEKVFKVLGISEVADAPSVEKRSEDGVNENYEVIGESGQEKPQSEVSDFDNSSLGEEG